MKHEIFPEQKWFWGVLIDRAGAGQKMGGIYSISIILPWLFSFFSSPSGAVKLAMFFSTLFFITAFFHIARLYMPNLFAFIASLAVLTPMFDNIVSGMWYNYFALGCGLMFWASCNNFVREKRTRYFISAVVFFTLAAYSHPVGVMLCIAVFLAYLFFILASADPEKWKLFSIVLFIPCISMFLSFPQLQTILGIDATSTSLIREARIYEYPVTSIVETMRRLLFVRVWGAAEPSALMALNILSVLVLCLFGLLALSSKRDYEKLVPLITLFFVTAILISRIYNYLEINSSALRSLSVFYDRFQLLSQIFLILLAGTGMSFLVQRMEKNGKRNFFMQSLAILLLVSLIGIALRTPKKIWIDQSGQLQTLQKSIIRPHANALWKWIDANIQTEEERIYFEDTYGKFAWNDASNPESTKSHLLALTSIYTDARQIGGWCGFTTRFAQRYEQGTAFGMPVGDPAFTDAFIAGKMKMLNTRYIVANSETLTTRLQRVPFLQEVEQFGVFHIFKNRSMQPAWAYNVHTGIPAQLTRHSSTHFEIVAEGKKGQDIHVSMAYHPNYIATAGREKIPVNNQASLISVKLPADGKQAFQFHYTFKKRMALTPVVAGLIFFIIASLSLTRLFPAVKKRYAPVARRLNQ
ncbi:MAG: hypothetical protein RBS82_13430 [Syntrophales bacterium]|nr:hypothetical protein [Syntrophales bacterium]